MPNLLEMMSAEERQTMKKWAEERQNPKYKQDIPTPLYICAQLGYYYGWGAVVDYRRGYSVVLDENGEYKAQEFGPELAIGLIKAAEKLHYRLGLDQSRLNSAAITSSHDQKYAQAAANFANAVQDDVLPKR